MKYELDIKLSYKIMIFPNIRIFNIKEFDKYTKDSFSAINS